MFPSESLAVHLVPGIAIWKPLSYSNIYLKCYFVKCIEVRRWLALNLCHHNSVEWLRVRMSGCLHIRIFWMRLAVSVSVLLHSILFYWCHQWYLGKYDQIRDVSKTRPGMSVLKRIREHLRVRDEAINEMENKWVHSSLIFWDSR